MGILLSKLAAKTKRRGEVLKKFMIVLMGAVFLGGCNLDNDTMSEAVNRAVHVDSTDNIIEETGKEVQSSYTVADYIKSVEVNLEANSDALIEKLLL